MTRGALGGLPTAGGLVAAGLFLAADGKFTPAGSLPNRMPARPPELVDGGAPFRVLLVGTSLTARGDWPFQLGEALAACRGGPVVVERLARPGATSAWGRDALAARLAAPGPPPTLALIEFTVNDARLHAGVPLARSRAHAGKMTALVRGRGGLPVLVTMSPVHGLALLRRPAVAAYRRAWAGVAAAAGAGHVDTVPAFAVAERRELREAIPDGIHPTDAAMRARLVPALTAVLEPLVRLSPGTAASQLPLPSRRH